MLREYKYELSYHDTADGVRLNVTVRDDNLDVAIKEIDRVYTKLRKTKPKFTKMETLKDWH